MAGYLGRGRRGHWHQAVLVWEKVIFESKTLLLLGCSPCMGPPRTPLLDATLSPACPYCTASHGSLTPCSGLTCLLGPLWATGIIGGCGPHDTYSKATGKLSTAPGPEERSEVARWHPPSRGSCPSLGTGHPRPPPCRHTNTDVTYI